MARELPIEERERMEAARLPQHCQTSFEAGYRAALAAREDTLGLTAQTLNVFSAVLTALEVHAPEDGALRPVATIDAGRKALAREVEELPGELERLKTWVEILERETNLEHRDNDEQVQVEGGILHSLQQAIRAVLSAGAVEKLPGERSCLVRISGGDCSQRQLQMFASGVLEMLEKYLPHLGAVVSCDLDAMTVEVVFTPERELPGDGQRPLLRWSDRDVRAMLAAGHASSTALSSLMERAQEKGYVRDTEREHEPAKVNVPGRRVIEDDGTEGNMVVASAYSREQGVIDALRILQNRTIGSPEACERAIDRLVAGLAAAEPDHAEVLAKALDQFLGVAKTTTMVRDLREKVQPTLQALGYPKEAGS